jgi:hypothetical protein
MSLVTLERFLRSERKASAPPPAQEAALPSIVALLSEFLGEPAPEPMDDLGHLRTWLSAWRERQDQISQAKRADLERIFGLLNEALGLAIAGSDRSAGRLGEIEQKLSNAAQTQDLQQLKRRLGDVIDIVRREADKEKAVTRQALAKFEAPFEELRATIGQHRRRGGRDKAIEAILGRIQEPHLHAVVLILERLKLIASRHGSGVCDAIVDALESHRLGALGAGERAFRWSEDALLLLVKHPQGKASLQTVVSQGAGTAFDHSVFLGSRTAVFSVPLSSLVIPLGGDPTAAIFEIDRFAGLL